MKVFIKVANMNTIYNIFADDKTGECVFNGKNIEYDTKEFVKKIALVTNKWPQNNYGGRTFDGEEYKIKIVNDVGKERVIVGKNQYPANYGEFSKLIREVVKLWI